MMYIPTTFATYLLVGVVYLVVQAIDQNMGTNYFRSFAQNAGAFYWGLFVATCLSLALISVLMSRLLLSWAQRYVADRERTRHWHDEPVYRKRKRVVVAQ